MLKSVEKSYLLLRCQVSSPGYTRVRDKFNPSDQHVGGVSEVDCKSKVTVDATPALRGLNPTQTQI